MLKPQTYMNLAGRAVASVMGFYKLGVDDLLVVVDDIALQVGTIRLRATGSAGGHNGLKDIQRAVSTMEYSRLRIGVDPPGIVPQKDYVLTAFTPEQKPLMEGSLKMAVEAMGVWVKEGIVAGMNRFNGDAKG